VGSEREREEESARACVSSLSLFDARNRGEMIQTESPSFFNASVRVVYDMCFVKMRTRELRREKKKWKKKSTRIKSHAKRSLFSLSLIKAAWLYFFDRTRVGEKRRARERCLLLERRRERKREGWARETCGI
jgi:hypothetical protein